jgi:hypothetical protein
MNIYVAKYRFFVITRCQKFEVGYPMVFLARQVWVWGETLHVTLNGLPDGENFLSWVQV